MMVSLMVAAGQLLNGRSPLATKWRVSRARTDETAVGAGWACAGGLAGSAGGVASLDGAADAGAGLA
ncbi:hypothetical protein, partial [Ralstonia mannitolilytica]